MQIKKRFKSKKNRVYKIEIDGQERVLKIFSSKDALEREYSILKTLQGKMKVPEVYEVDFEKKSMILEFILGENLCDFINSERENKMEIIRILASWFSDFHDLFKNESRIRGDSILRNFILKDKNIYGLDFEESRIGKFEEDVAEICLSILTTGKMFSEEKFALCKEFLDVYEERIRIDRRILSEEFYRNLLKISERRRDEKIKINGIRKLREHGMINSVI